MTTLSPIDGTRVDSSGNALVSLGKSLAGERNEESAVNGYLVTRNECNVTICDGTTAVTIGGGAIGDTHIIGLIILKNAGPATATVEGFIKKNNAGTEAAQTIIFTGSTADDRYIDLKGAINTGAICKVTSSVDECVLVLWRPL